MKIQQWQRSQVVYRVDPELVAALLDTDQAATTPGEIFQRPPHPDPMVLLDPPLELPGTDQHLLGFLTGAETDRGELVSTADAQADGLAVSLCRQGPRGTPPRIGGGFQIDATLTLTVEQMIQQLADIHQALPDTEDIAGTTAARPSITDTVAALPPW